MAGGRPRSIWTTWACLGAMVLLLAVACTATTVSGSGTQITRKVSVSSFSRIEVDGPFDVSVTQGEPAQVTLRVDDNPVDRLDVGVSSGRLRLGLEPQTSVRRATLHAEVTAPSLTGIEVSGAGSVHLSNEIKGRTLAVTLSGA